MKLNSSSIFSFNATARVLGATLGWLVLLDFGASHFTRRPSSARAEASGLARYFDYGRSVESKLRAMVGSDRASSAKVTLVGWLGEPSSLSNQAHPQPATASDRNHVLVAVYGQSFTERAAQALSAIDPRFETRFLGGPAAPLSHSFSAYEADRGKQTASVVAIGVLASSFARLTSLTNMTLWFESPQPMTYPRFLLEDGQLRKIEPEVRSFEDLQAAVHDPARWERFVAQLRTYDAAYDPLVFEQDALDGSAFGRAIRRALGQRHAREFIARYIDEHGFTNRDHLLDIGEAILTRFASEARADGKMPYVLLIDDLGYSGMLRDALGPRLERHGIPYLSSDGAIAADDPANFVADGHFRPDLDRALGAAWAADLRGRVASKSAPHPTRARLAMQRAMCSAPRPTREKRAELQVYCQGTPRK